MKNNISQQLKIILKLAIKKRSFKNKLNESFLLNNEVDIEKAKAKPLANIKVNQFLNSRSKCNFGYTLIRK